MNKLINKKSFYLILAAILGYWALQIASLIINLANVDQTVDEMINNPLFGSLYTDSDRESLKSISIITTISGAIIVIGLSSIFLVKLLGHRKHPQKGTYITVMLVFAIIIGGISLISLISGDFFSIGMIAVLGLVIAGYAIQKNDKLTPYAPPSQPLNQYGQPYGQQYGPPQYPYGQPPYNQQSGPFSGPYQQPQNPYADPYRQPQQHDDDKKNQ